MEEGYTSDESHLMVYLDLLPAPSPFDSMVCSSSSFDVDFDLLPSVGSPSSSCIVLDFDLLSSNSPSGLPADASSVLDENFGALPNSCEYSPEISFQYHRPQRPKRTTTLSSNQAAKKKLNFYDSDVGKSQLLHGECMQ